MKAFFDISAKNILRSMAGTGLAFIARRHRSVLKQMNVKTNDYFTECSTGDI